MTNRDAVRDAVSATFESANYPISGPMEIVPALPNGPRTKIEADDFSMSAMELYTTLDGDFPYESNESFVDDIMSQLAENGHL